jgi:predicted O-methyltransferase YrrM
VFSVRGKIVNPLLCRGMRLPRLRTLRAWRRGRRTLAAVAVAGLLLILVGVPAAGAGLFGFALVALILLESAQLQRVIRESERQQQALTQIRPLLGELPLDFSGWAADPVTVHNAVRLVVETRPGLVVECGSGNSTVVIARCLRALGRGRMISLDHDPAYARRTAELLRLHGVDDLVTVVGAPLVAREADGQVVQWYGPQYEPLLDGPIDILLVDGPPGASSRLARYPAVPILQPHLAPTCSILLDDGDRVDERTIASLWARGLGATLSYLEGGRGGWLLRRQGPPLSS